MLGLGSRDLGVQVWVYLGLPLRRRQLWQHARRMSYSLKLLKVGFYRGVVSGLLRGILGIRTIAHIELQKKFC